MITSVTTTDKAKWDKLFEEASVDAGTKITTLREYIDQLNKLVGQKGKYQYLRMPGEPEFVIDDVTRGIIVPEVFKKNGLGVAGDHQAETVFFRMGRYFDGMDLNNFRGDNAKDGVCLIHWKRRGPQGDSRLSKAVAFTAYSKDDDGHEDEIYFGWTITEEVTEVEGIIDFAVRFVKIDENNKLKYALSTQSNFCSINPALELPNEEDFSQIDIEDVEDEILHRVVYSGVVNTVASSMPRILVDLPSSSDLNDVEGESEQSLDLMVSAKSDENGTLTYAWRKSDSNDALPSREITEDDGSVTSICHVEEHGEYYVHVGNETEKGIRYRTSNTCNIPGARNIAIPAGEDLVAQGYVQPTEEFEPIVLEVKVCDANEKGEPTGVAPNGTVSYIWKKDDEVIAGADTTKNTYAPTEEGMYSVEIINRRNNDSKTVKSANVCEARNAPVKPEGVEIVYDAEAKVLTCNVASPSRDLAYRWSSTEGGLLHGDEYDPYMRSFALSEEQAKVGNYVCAVKQIIFYGSGNAQDSPHTHSNYITLEDGVQVI